MKKIFCLIIFFGFITTCHSIPIRRMPSRMIDSDIKKIFLAPDFINIQADSMKLREEFINTLKLEFDKIGRFELVQSSPKFDPERERVLLAGLTIVSRSNQVAGQRTEFATCSCINCVTTGVGETLANIASSAYEKQGISSHGVECMTRSGSPTTCNFICTRPNIVKMATEFLAEMVEGPKPKDEVIRTYKYRNVNFMLQVGLELFELGKERKQIMLLSASSAANRHIPDPETFVNVRAASQTYPEIFAWLSASPVVPVLNRNYGVIEASNPGSELSNWVMGMTDSPERLPRSVLKEIREALVKSTVSKLLASFSPYETGDVQPDEQGDLNAVEALKLGQAKYAIGVLAQANEGPDLFNLGLSHEASAKSIEGLKKAEKYYRLAYMTSPNEDYALALGRVRNQIRFHERLRKNP